MASELSSCKGMLCLVSLLAFSSPHATASAQVELRGLENEPGRIFYHCRKHFGSGTAARGSLNVSKDVAEDGSVLRMNVRWSSHVSNNPMIETDIGLVPLFGAEKRGFVTFDWPSRFPRTRSQFDWANPDVGILVNAGYRSPARLLELDEPWQQIFIDRGDRLRIYEMDGEHFVDHRGNFMFMSPLKPAYSPRFLTSLADLAAWTSGVETLTVYETRVAIGESNQPDFPYTLGRHRIHVAYQLDANRLVEIAQTVRAVVEDWETSIEDIGTECERREEINEPPIIVKGSSSS